MSYFPELDELIAMQPKRKTGPRGPGGPQAPKRAERLEAKAAQMRERGAADCAVRHRTAALIRWEIRRCRNCDLALVQRPGEPAQDFQRRSFCDKGCVLAARNNGKLICRTLGDQSKPKRERAKAKPPRLGNAAFEERMPWPAEYGSVDFRMRSSLAAVVDEGEA